MTLVGVQAQTAVLLLRNMQMLATMSVSRDLGAGTGIWSTVGIPQVPVSVLLISLPSDLVIPVST